MKEDVVFMCKCLCTRVRLHCVQDRINREVVNVTTLPVPAVLAALLQAASGKSHAHTHTCACVNIKLADMKTVGAIKKAPLHQKMCSFMFAGGLEKIYCHISVITHGLLLLFVPCRWWRVAF